jgi:hypothetical protein
MRTVYTKRDLAGIEKSETVIYHRGPTLGLCAIGHDVWELYERGSVTLTQKRLGPPIDREGRIDWRNGVSKDGFEYRATGV